MPKRKAADIDSISDLINQDNNGLLNGLLQLDRDQLAALLAHIANEAGTARTELPSFSVAKWSKFAEQFGLPQDVSALTPRYCLPPSFQEAMFENAWRWQDVYREKVDHTREEARVRILDPYIVPIVALFQGRVIDKPDHIMMETTGGEVEHKMFIIPGVLFFVIELKLGGPDGNALAQMFLELLFATEMNNSNSTHMIPPPINSVLTRLVVINNKRTDAFSDMMDVSNKIFGIVLSGYMDGLRAYIAKSKDKKTGSRKSIDQWEAAQVLAERCCAKFKEPAASLAEIEQKANEALGLLTKSVRSIPRASTFTGGDDDPSTPAELKALATRVAKETYERDLSSASQA